MSSKDKKTILKMPSLMVFDGEYTIDAYVLKFPEEIYNKFLNKYQDDNYKDRNMKISELNSSLMSYLTDIYFANFIKRNNLDKGWIISSNPDYIYEIRYQLSLWLEKIGLKGFDHIVESLEFEKQTFIVNKDDIRENNLKCRLLLSYLSKDLAEKLNYTVRVNKKEDVNLEFTYVNNDDKFRVLGLFPDRKVTVGKEDFYYNYYFELYPVKLDNKENPCIGINIGKLMLAYKNAETYDSNIYPYILLNNSMSEGEYKTTAFRGLIERKKDYKWNSFAEYAVNKTTGKSLPKIDDLIKNPIDYIDSNLDISVLIPHGTHMKSTNHIVGSGVDFEKRITLLKMIEEELNNYNIFNGCIYLEKDSKSSTLRKNKKVASDVDEITLNLFYTTDETREVFNNYIDIFNDKDLITNLIKKILPIDNEIKLLKKNIKELSESIKEIDNKEDKTSKDLLDKDKLSTQVNLLKSKIKDLEEEKEIELKVLGDVDIKSIEKLYATLAGKGKDIDNIFKCPNIKLNCIDYSHTNPYKIQKSRSSKNNFEKEFSLLDCDEVLGVSVVELEDKEYFRRAHIFDPKSTIRKLIAKNYNKSSQFTTPIDKDDDTKYDKLNNIILECFRHLGYVHVKENITDDTAYIGVVKESSNIVMTCIIGKKTYGKYKNSPWLSYNELLVMLASDNKKENFNYSVSYLEDAIDEACDIFDVKHSVVYILNRQLKSTVPYIKNLNGNFNLKINNSDDTKDFVEYKNDKVTVILVDDTIEAEWFPVDDNGEIKKSSFCATLSQINEKLFMSICSGKQGVLQNFMYGNSKIYREDSFKTIKEKVFKSEPILMYFGKTAKGYENLLVARDAHFSKTDTSIQHYGVGSTEETKLPLGLNITALASKFLA